MFGRQRRANRPEDKAVNTLVLPQPEQALMRQQKAEKLQELAQRQEQVTLLLQSALIQQRGILSAWGDLDDNEDDDLTTEALAFETAFQGLIGRAIELTRKALLLQQREVNHARITLEASAEKRVADLNGR